MLSLHMWEELWDPAGGHQGWANPWHSLPILTQKCHENLKKQKRETSHFQAVNEEKAGMLWHSTSGKQFSELLLPPQGEGAAQRFGERKSNFCSWALGSSQWCSQGTAPHECVPVFSFWDQGWQVVLVSHPRQPLSSAGRLHPMLKTPQLLPQQLLPLPCWGAQAHKALRTRCIPKNTQCISF